MADPPVATYSIAACDLEAGRWGVATQSKFLGVGSIVPWAEAGAGATLGPLAHRSASVRLDYDQPWNDGVMLDVERVEGHGSADRAGGDRRIQQT